MVRMYSLPFYAGEDIKEEILRDYFCDRELETKEIVQLLGAKEKHHIALVGKRRIGKSSLMLKCKSELEKKGMICVFIRVEKVYPFNLNNFFIHILTEIESCQKDFIDRIKKIGKKMAKSVKPKKIGVDISGTISLWMEFNSNEDNKQLPDLMKKTFNIIDYVGKKYGKIIIMLDEFQKTFEFGSDFLWSLRGSILDLNKSSFIVSSSLNSFEDEITKNKKQPFFNFFNLKRIEELPENEARVFIKQRFDLFGLNINEDALILFLNLTNCYPYYVQALGLKCYEIVNAEDLKIIDKGLVLRAYEYLFDILPQHLISEFGKLSGKMKDIVVIMALKGLERPRDIAEELNINLNTIGGFLSKIENRHGIIEKVERGKYKFSDNFLSEWIKRNHSKDPVKINVGIEKEEPFNSELVDNYIDILKTTDLSSENINRLLQSIRNEAYKIYRKNEINKSELSTIENLIIFIHDYMKNKDNDIKEKMLDILYLLIQVPEASQLGRKICYDYFIEIYLSGWKSNDLVKILDAWGYFGDKIPEIMKVIDEKDNNLLDTIISRLDFSEIRDKKFEIIKQLILKLESLKTEKDKSLISKIENLIRQLEIA